MRTPLAALALVVAAGTFIACEKSDVEQVPGFTARPWRTDVNFVDATNSPDSQIVRFVARNGMDTVMTPSGLVFQIDDPGAAVKPTLDSTVTFYYRGYLVNGRIFDESRDGSPSTQPLDKLIKGWREALPYLGAGGRMWMLVRPSLAYGNTPPPNTPITSQSVLVFELELVAP